VQRFLVVANGAAGTTDDDSVEAAVATLRTGAEVTLAETADPKELLAAVTVGGW